MNQIELLIKQILCCTILISVVGYCYASPQPTVTPAILPRTLGSTQRFPWQESWRFEMHLFDAYQNTRNLIAVKEGVVFVDNPTANGVELLKFVNSDGTLRWTVHINGLVDSIAADGDLLYVAGSNNGRHGVTAYKLQSGELIWSSKTILPDHTGYDIELREQHLYVYSTQNQIYSFEAETGDLIDRFSAAGGENSYLLLRLENERLLWSKDGHLVLTRDDAVVWQAALRAYRLHKFPEIYDSIIVIKFESRTSPFSGLAGVNLSTSELMWQRLNEFYSNFVIVDDLLYVVSKEANILVLDPKSGRTVGYAELSPNSVDTRHPISAIAVNEKMLYVYFVDSQELIAFEKVTN